MGTLLGQGGGIVRPRIRRLLVYWFSGVIVIEARIQEEETFEQSCMQSCSG